MITINFSLNLSVYHKKFLNEQCSIIFEFFFSNFLSKYSEILFLHCNLSIPSAIDFIILT